MCNACGNLCCGSDEFSHCGCNHCDCEDCWDEYDDDEDGEFEDSPPQNRRRFVCKPMNSEDRAALGQILSDALNGKS